MVTADLIGRARAGDGEAFRALTEPHRRELQVHCYRMLGSVQDAEDVLQDTLLAAWQGLAGFEGRASLRTWLYKIATNRCLNARRAASRRPAKEWDIPGVEPPSPPGSARSSGSSPIPTRSSRVPTTGRPARRPATNRPKPLAGLRDRPSGPAAPPGRRPGLARRPRLPRARGGRHARHHGRIGHQRAEAGPRQPAAPTAPGRRRRTASRVRLALARRRSWRSSSAPGSPPTSTRWWRC